MEGYPYPYSYPQMHPEEYPDHGDGIEYYGPVDEHRSKRRSRSKQRKAKQRTSKRSRSRSISDSRSRTRTRSKSRTRSQSRSSYRDRSRSRSGSRKEINLKSPGVLDAFRVLYLKPSKHKKNTTKYLATKKKQDRIQEILKSDGLGSKKWLFYPRNKTEPAVKPVSTCDKRVKVDGDFFNKYKKSKHVDADAPIAKLKRWELIFYKKLGFIQAV